MIRNSLHSAMINFLLQDPTDRQYVAKIKKFLDDIPKEEYVENPDLAETYKLINKIVEENIKDRMEIIYHMSTIPYSYDFKLTLTERAEYSPNFKKDILNNMSADLMASRIRPYLDSISDDLDRVQYDTSSKEAGQASVALVRKINELSQMVNRTMISSETSTTMMIDPMNEDGMNSVLEVVQDSKESAMKALHINDVLDMFFGGGLSDESLTLFAAYTGCGKSLIMQNLAIHTSKANQIEDIMREDGLTPCILYISLELTRKQMLRRHLAWCGKQMNKRDFETMSTEEITKLVFHASKEAGLKIPILYVERLAGFSKTNAVDIEAEVRSHFQAGRRPIMIIIDYIDRMDVVSRVHQNMGTTGADGSAVLKQKCKEARDISINLKIPVVSAAQLNSMAGNMISEVAPYYKYVDILHNFKMDWCAGSRVLGAELEYLIFCHTFHIEDLQTGEDGEDIRINNSYLSMCMMKDRDNVAYYNPSNRDRLYESNYVAHYNSAKVGRAYSTFLKNSGNQHIVMSMEGFKISDSDYGRSITMFYPDIEAGRASAYQDQAKTISNQQQVEALFDGEMEQN